MINTENKKAQKATSCHAPYPAVEQSIFLLHQNGEAETIGSVLVCFWTGWKGRQPVDCFKPTGDVRWFQNCPKDLGFEVWRQTANAGWVYRYERGGGFYFARSKQGALSPLPAGGPGYQDLVGVAPKAEVGRVAGFTRPTAQEIKRSLAKHLGQSEIDAIKQNVASHGLKRKEILAADAYAPEPPEFPMNEECEPF